MQVKKHGSVRQIHHLLSHRTTDLVWLVYACVLTTEPRRITTVWVLSGVNKEHYNAYTI